jgi:hypothetical protein
LYLRNIRRIFVHLNGMPGRIDKEGISQFRKSDQRPFEAILVFKAERENDISSGNRKCSKDAKMESL